MHDPKFEKEVQHKLEELSFSPSEAVWTNVERAVNGKKRRKVPVFWLFLLPALMLTGAGAIYLSTRTVPAPKVEKEVANASVPKTDVPHTPAPETANPTTVSPAATSPAIASRGTATTAGTSSIVRNTQPSRNTLSSPASGRRIHTNNSSVTAPHNVTTADLPDNSPVEEETAPVRATATTTGRANLPGLNAFDHHFSAPAAARPSFRSQTNTAAKVTIQLKPKYTWEAGFAGGIGISSLNKTLFEQPSTVATASDLSLNGGTINGSPKSYTSKIRPDLSYWAGITAERPLSSRLTLALGLNLHYYSTKIQIGEKVDAPSSLNPSYYSQSLFTSRVQTAAMYPYYSVGDKNDYTNRYYFVELPASILWQVNHSRNLPLFWEGGVSLAYLVSSNALYYNPKSSVFYKDGGMTNKTQLNLATALLVGLPIRGIRLQAGPQIQYGITSLQNNVGTGGQHLFYGGLRLILLPGKARK